MAPVIMGNPERPELAEELANSFCRTDPAIARAFARATFLSDNRADLAKVAVPTLILQCSRDAIAPAEVGAFVHAQIPGSTLVTLAATGHCPQLSAPEATARGDRGLRLRPAVSSTGHSDSGSGEGGDGQGPNLASLLEDSAEDLYENAPCGYLSTFPDGQIARVNATLLTWLGYTRGELVGHRYFSDLLTVGGRLYHETHFAPLLAMQGEINGVALELRGADNSRLPVLVSSTVKTGATGEPLLIRTTIFDARDRRAYERELLRARREADLERERLQLLVTTLQRTLLPPALPDVPGLEAAAYYHAASRDEVGGDFYDLFAIARDRWGLFLGDVCGKGTVAAAMTSLVRYTLRAAAVYDPDPAAVLGTLNTALRRDYDRNDGRFCTAAFGVLTPRGDGFALSLASGGHPRAPAATRGRHRQLPAGLRRPVPRRHRRRGVRRHHDPAGRRRHPSAVHRRAHRGTHRQRTRPLR